MYSGFESKHMFSIISGKKTFDDRWIGSPFLNHLGLHRWRINASQTCKRIRQLQYRRTPDPMLDSLRDLERQGFVAVDNFLPTEVFQALSTEVEATFSKVERQRPIRPNDIPGFGEKRPFPGGFDRYDGGTLNRFLSIEASRHPETARVLSDPRLDALTSGVCGKRHNPRKAHLYLTVNGEQQQNADLQKVMHRDTYFSAMKYWFFLRPVELPDGPFTYVPGSHRPTASRLDWEQAMASQAAQGRAEWQNQGGSFRVDEAALADLELPPPCHSVVPPIPW